MTATENMTQKWRGKAIGTTKVLVEVVQAGLQPIDHHVQMVLDLSPLVPDNDKNRIDNVQLQSNEIFVAVSRSSRSKKSADLMQSFRNVQHLHIQRSTSMTVWAPSMMRLRLSRVPTPLRTIFQLF